MKRTEFVKSTIDFTNDPGRTLQSDAKDADINNIMKKWLKTGQSPPPRGLPQYGDFSNVDDYLTAVNQVHEAQAAFEELPSAVRSRFRNDPGELIQFLSTPGHEDEAIELGLYDPKDQDSPADEPKQGQGGGEPPTETAGEA